MCPGSNDSEDEEQGEDEDREERGDEDEEEVDADEQEDIETDDSDEANRTPAPFGIGSVVRNMQETLNAINSLNIHQFIDPEIMRLVNDPIGPDLRWILAQSTIDPELIHQIQQPVIDPELLESIEQPAIDPELLRNLSQPAIDPELIETLQTLNNSTVLELYQTAAALEQIDLESVDEFEEEPDEELEGELEEDLEPPQQGGFLSTFLNGTAVFLLHQSDQFPEESVSTLHTLLESESVQAKTDAFRNFVSTAGNSASRAIIMATLGAFHLSWGMHFGDELDSNDNTTDEDDTGEDQDRDEG